MLKTVREIETDIDATALTGPRSFVGTGPGRAG